MKYTDKDLEIIEHVTGGTMTKILTGRDVTDYLKRCGYFDYLFNRFDNNTVDKNDIPHYISETIFRLVHGIETPPVCKTCGDKLTYSRTRSRCKVPFYGEFCSRKCSNADPDILKRNAESVSKSLKRVYAERGDEVKIKRAKTLSEKYGVEATSSPFSINEIQDLSRERVIERYGADNVLVLKENREKLLKSFRKNREDKWKEKGYDVEFLDGRRVRVNNCCEIHGAVEMDEVVFNNRFRDDRREFSEPCPLCHSLKMRSGEEMVFAKYLDLFGVEYTSMIELLLSRLNSISTFHHITLHLN